jgi:hypothetical protein
MILDMIQMFPDMIRMFPDMIQMFPRSLVVAVSFTVNIYDPTRMIQIY